MSSRLRQVLPYVVVLAAAGLLYAASTRIQVDTGGRIGPAFWPRVILAFIALLCAYEIVKRLVARSDFTATGVVGALAPGQAAPLAEPRKLAAGIALVVAYVVCVSWLGFFLATAAFLAIFPWIGGLRRPVLVASAAIAGSLALVVVFMRVAYISLPLGEGPFRALSLALLRAIGVT